MRRLKQATAESFGEAPNGTREGACAPRTEVRGRTRRCCGLSVPPSRKASIFAKATARQVFVVGCWDKQTGAEHRRPKTTGTLLRRGYGVSRKLRSRGCGRKTKTAGRDELVPPGDGVEVGLTLEDLAAFAVDFHR